MKYICSLCSLKSLKKKRNVDNFVKLNVIHVLFNVEGKLDARLISRSESDELSVCGSEIQEITRNIMNLSCDFRFSTQGYSQRIRL